ncbi:MAG TPA: hypothetical protein VHO28_08370, partial [Ignavibacteriales bacterium]|nr:hypothetical protein [Ignavibacteriales bacterium]
MRTRLFLLSVIFISPVLCLLYGQETEYKLQLMKVGIAGDQFQSIESDTLRYSFYNDPNDLYSSYNSKSFYTN